MSINYRFKNPNVPGRHTFLDVYWGTYYLGTIEEVLNGVFVIRVVDTIFDGNVSLRPNGNGRETLFSTKEAAAKQLHQIWAILRRKPKGPDAEDLEIEEVKRMKLKSIIKENTYGKFWWMDPMGRLQRIMKIDPQTGHNEAAISILQTLGVSPEKDIYKQMYDLGWIRVSYVGNQGYYTLEFNTNFDKQPSSRQMAVLKDLATELNAFEIRNGSTKQTYSFGLWY